jgi:hypothetical protein
VSQLQPLLLLLLLLLPAPRVQRHHLPQLLVHSAADMTVKRCCLPQAQQQQPQPQLQEQTQHLVVCCLPALLRLLNQQ